MGEVECGFLRKRTQTLNSEYDGKELRLIFLWVTNRSYTVF